MLCGVGFSAQGLFEGSYYRRMPGAADPRAAWIFEGIDDEIIGDFGLSGGGATGFELDRADFELGTPPNTLVLARSEAHQSHFVVVPEELLTHVTTVTGERPNALIRAEIVYFETVGGGAVFSTGSITFCGSLSHNSYDNNVSRILERLMAPTWRYGRQRNQWLQLGDYTLEPRRLDGSRAPEPRRSLSCAWLPFTTPSRTESARRKVPTADAENCCSPLRSDPGPGNKAVPAG